MGIYWVNRHERESIEKFANAVSKALKLITILFLEHCFQAAHLVLREQGGTQFCKLPARLRTTHTHVQVDLVEKKMKYKRKRSDLRYLYDNKNKQQPSFEAQCSRKSLTAACMHWLQYAELVQRHHVEVKGFSFPECHWVPCTKTQQNTH